MKGRSNKSLQRKRATKQFWYCKDCGLPLIEKKDLCGGCLEAHDFAQRLKRMIDNGRRKKS